MERVLVVGDVHATPEELDDCESLMDYVRGIASDANADRVCLLGDSYHTHNVIRAEVMAFWRDTFRKFKAVKMDVTALVGNHDYAGEGQKIHSMMAHEHMVEVVDGPIVHGNVLYVPYCASHEDFVRYSQEAPGCGTLVCHQTFDGSRYENGYPALDGVNPNLIKQKLVISGHIHTPQGFSVPGGPDIEYIGAPRWRTLSDANLERSIWLYDFDDAGLVVQRQGFGTQGVCRQIRSITDTQEQPVELPLQAGVDWRIDIRGSSAWVQARKEALSGPGVRIRTFITTSTKPAVRESEGIAPAFRGYLSKYQPKFGTPAEVLAEMASERLGV